MQYDYITRSDTLDEITGKAIRFLWQKVEGDHDRLVAVFTKKEHIAYAPVEPISEAEAWEEKLDINYFVCPNCLAHLPTPTSSCWGCDNKAFRGGNNGRKAKSRK